MKLSQNILFGAVLSIFLASTPAAFAQQAVNLINNPSFAEKGVEGQSAIAGWNTRIRGDIPDLKPTFTQGQNGQDGKPSARFDVPKTQSPSKKNGMVEWFQSVPVLPGTRYYFSVYLRTGDLADCWVNASVEQLSANQPEVYPAKSKGVVAVESEDTKGTANEWHLLEGTIKTGPETNYLRVSLRMQDIGTTGQLSGGWAEFSNAKLIELPAEK